MIIQKDHSENHHFHFRSLYDNSKMALGLLNNSNTFNEPRKTSLYISDSSTAERHTVWV